MHMWHSPIPCTLAFVTRFTAEELPHHIKKLIEEGLQEWEGNLCKVTFNAPLNNLSYFDSYSSYWTVDSHLTDTPQL